MSEEFGSILKIWRIRKGVTQRQVAVALGVTPSYVNLLERGRTRAPTVERCRQIADFLQVDEREVIRAALQERSPDLEGMLDTRGPCGSSVPVLDLKFGGPTELDECGLPVANIQDWLPMDDLGDPRAFGYRLNDGSVPVGGMDFGAGDVLVFSPGASVGDGDFALLTLKGRLCLGRMFRVDGWRVRVVETVSRPDGDIYDSTDVGVTARLMRRVQHY